MLTEVNCKVLVNPDTGALYLVFRDECEAEEHEHLFKNRATPIPYACCGGFLNALEII